MDKRCIATINRINPITPMAPKATKNAVKPAESPKKGTANVPVLILVAAVAIIETTKATTPIIPTIGKTTEIKLAIKPNFLPDSSATFHSSNVIVRDLG